jgi:uncharacterized SAM-binding protein YcdF (DUF218 family)
LVALIALALALVVGFWGFARNVDRAAPPTPLPEADAIVALTGGSVERLTTGMELLAEGRGRRLLISGVNPKVTDGELEKLLHGGADLFKCCVDVGRRAADTLGNAAETADWAERNGFHRVIVVTDNYHMPRSLAELRLAMPGVTLTAYPVKTRIARRGVWQNDIGAAARLAGEYVKYLVIRARELVLSNEKPANQPAKT